MSRVLEALTTTYSISRLDRDSVVPRVSGSLRILEERTREKKERFMREWTMWIYAVAA